MLPLNPLQFQGQIPDQENLLSHPPVLLHDQRGH